MARPAHKKAHANCEYGAANWGDCDKARAIIVDDWCAMQQVLLAYKIAMDGRRIKEDNVFAQLVDVVSGHKPAIMTKEGNPNVTPWVARLMSAIERVKAGDVPAYNLYRVD